MCAVCSRRISILCVMLFVSLRGHAVAQARSCELIIMEISVQSEARPCEFVVDRVTLGDRFQSECSISPLPQIFPSSPFSSVMSVACWIFVHS
jgi:hypothetical protein